MNNKEKENPFWITPPFILLTDVLQLDKIEPWNVDVGKLVREFLREMKRMGEINFRISGNALYSASVIFMRKTRELVKLGFLPPEEETGDEEEIEIPLIRPPFRLTNRRVTIEELLVAMEKVLSKGIRQRPVPTRTRTRPKVEPVSFKMDSARIDVEETIREVYTDLRKMMNIGEITTFTSLLINHTRREIVRLLFALLHLYARAYVDIWMDENEIIWIKLIETSEIENHEVIPKKQKNGELSG